MTPYQLDLVIQTYFDKLLELGIKETDVIDFGQKNGELYIILENEKITEKIKNFYI